MNKKIPILILVCVVLAVVGYSFYRMNQNAIRVMTGNIIGIDTGTIILEGEINQAKRVVEFTITDNTKFRKTVRVITEEQIRSGKPYVAETREEETTMAGLMEDKSAQNIKITSKENLAKKARATATEAHYSSFDIPILKKL